MVDIVSTDLLNVGVINTDEINEIKEQQEQSRALDRNIEALGTTMEELNKLQEQVNTYLDLRNKFINKLYKDFGVSAIKLSEMTGLSRQMVHNLVKEEE